MSNFHPMTEIPTSNNPSDRRESSTSTTSTKSDKKLKLKQGYLPERSKNFFYHYSYLKMTFDPKLWEEEAIAIFATTVASLYATLLVCVYITFIFTELVRFPDFKDYLENHGFFIHLFLISDLYYIFVIFQVVASNMDSKRSEVNENDKSHGTLTVRFGAVLFGSVSLAHYLLRLVKFFETDSHAPFPCYEKYKGINYFLMSIFVILQTVIIFVFPRLNLLSFQIVNRYGTMHVAATNIILWIRTLVKETLEDIEEFEELRVNNEERRASHHTESASQGHNHGNKCDTFLYRINVSEATKKLCDEYRTVILHDAIPNSSPYMYPFIIEFVLIGAAVAYIMSNHIGKRPKHPQIPPNRIRKPDPIAFLKKKDFSHSLKGIMGGLVIVAIAVINLSLFFGLAEHSETESEAEFWSKITQTIINVVGIIALIIGIAETQQLNFRNPNKNHINIEMDLDMLLLRFTAIFSFLYMLFTIITGNFNKEIKRFRALNIINGVVSILQITLQIVFVYNLKNRVLPKDKEYAKPGRQMTVFFAIFNAAQWLIVTFEIQKVKANLVEADFFGFMPWLIIQRVTLPLAVFFHFHSAVVFVELFKEIYDEKEEIEEESRNGNVNRDEDYDGINL